MALIIRHALSTGGKAGKGHNKTSTIQVFDTETWCIVKSFRYTVGDRESYRTAVEKANKLCGK